MSGDDHQDRIAELCRTATSELNEVVPGIVDLIRDEIPEYGLVPRDEHERYVHEQYRVLLEGLATHRPPTVEQSALARDLGRRRAAEGVPVEAMISAYHIGYREIWNVLLTRAGSRDQELTARLVQLVNLVWSWLRLASGAAADAHGEVIRSRQAVQITLTHRFLDVLRGGDTESDEAVRLARALAFEPAGMFQAICTPVSSWSDERLDRLRRELDHHRGTVRSAVRGPLTIVVCQGVAAAVVISTIHRHHPGLPAGIGLARAGLVGAEASVVDAEQALALAGADGRAVDFQDEWLAATLLTERHRLAPVLMAGRGPAGAQPHLAEAVRAYAEHGFSVTAGARVLHVHPNTLAYRLDRWRSLTGWDPRTLDGLQRSLLALRLWPVK